MSQEYDNEPVRGLPGPLPKGEHILWQGSPDWQRLARDAFKTRWVAGYFAALFVWALVDGNWTGAAVTLGVAALGLGLLHGLSWAVARATVYTLTNRRVVMRFGVALPKCINLPVEAIGSAGLRVNADGTGDIPLLLIQPHRLGYAQFWPHARPWKIGRPEPMLRAIPDAATVAETLADALLAALPGGRRVTTDMVAQEQNGALATA